MIVKRIHAENLFKYAVLELTHVPARGIIAVSGPNESGKSAIAEIICLALFGRTSALEPQEISKCVKWGEFRGSVQLDFTGKEGHDYTVTRDLDGDGNHRARLSRSGEQTSLAQGAEAVTQMVTQLSGCGFERFLDGFYLTQRRLTTPQSVKSTIRALAGVDTLETLSAEFAQDINALQDSISHLTSQLTDTHNQLAALPIQDETLSQLSAQRQAQLEQVAHNERAITTLRSTADAVRTAMSRVAERVTQLTQRDVHTSVAQWQEHARQLEEALTVVHQTCRTAGPTTEQEFTKELDAWLVDFRQRLDEFHTIEHRANAYHQRLTSLLGEAAQPEAGSALPQSLPEQRAVLNKQLHTSARRRTRAVLGFVVTFLGALATGGAWWLLTFARDMELTQWLMAHLGLADISRVPLVLAASIAFTLIALIFLIRTFLSTRQVTRARRALGEVNAQVEAVRNEAQVMKQWVELPLPEAVATLRQLQDEQLLAAVTAFVNGPGAPLLDPSTLSAYFARLHTGLQLCVEGGRTLEANLDSQIKEGTSKIAEHQQKIRRLDQEIAEEQALREQAAQLRQQLRALQEQQAEQNRQIAIRQVARRLLEGTHHRLYVRFNLEMQRAVSEILSRLTAGRYHSLHIGDSFDIQLFSSEKNHFVGLHELSGGTDHQLMLALRLALSQAIISSSIGGAQCIILDEPFVFFDEHRAQLTLEVLPKISDDLAQVWVIAPRFDDDRHFAMHLRCTRESESLIVSGDETQGG